MRVEIIEVLPSAGQQLIVRFSGESGVTLAQWARSSSPVLAQHYSVELDTDVVIDGSTAVRNEHELFALGLIAGRSVLSGRLNRSMLTAWVT